MAYSPTSPVNLGILGFPILKPQSPVVALELVWMLSCISFPQTKDVFSWFQVTPLFPELVVLKGSVENEECGKCGVRKTRRVENVEHFNFNMKLTNNLIPLYYH